MEAEFSALDLKALSEDWNLDWDRNPSPFTAAILVVGARVSCSLLAFATEVWLCWTPWALEFSGFGLQTQGRRMAKGGVLVPDSLALS